MCLRIDWPVTQIAAELDVSLIETPIALGPVRLPEQADGAALDLIPVQETGPTDQHDTDAEQGEGKSRVQPSSARGTTTRGDRSDADRHECRA